MYTLENAYLKAQFDEKGRLTSLKNNNGGHGNILYKPADNAFFLVFKKGSDWENAARGGEQTFAVTQGPDSITFEAASLVTRAGPAAIGVRLTARLDGENLLFDAVIQNNEDVLITDFEYPFIGVTKTLGHGKPALLWPHQSGQIVGNVGEYLSKLPVSHEIHPNSLKLPYPGGASMQWMALTDAKETLYFTSHDADFYAGELRAEGSAENIGDVTLVINKMAFVKQGETWQAPSSLLKLYTGSWHHGAQDYIDWSKTWRPTHKKPKWIRDMAGFFLVINKQQFGYEMWPYDTLPYLYQQAVAHGCDTLGLFGWYDSGHDNQYPDLKVSETLGGAEMLKENIKQVQADGGNVVMYFQGHLIDITTGFYKNGGSRFETRSRNDTPYFECYHKSHQSAFLGNYTNKWFSISCPSCPEWQELMKEKTDFVASFGPNGVLFDQIGGMPAYPCFNEEHPHAKGKPSLSMSNGRMQLLSGIQQRTKEIDEEFAFFTEHITDLYSSYLDGLHGILSFPSGEGARADISADCDRAEIANYPELFRYCFPDVIITVRNPAPYIDPRMANFAFAFGFRFEMEIRYQADCDDIKAGKHADWRDYAASVTALRRKYWEFLGGEGFEDDISLNNRSTAIIAKGYRVGDRLAVTLWNDTASEEPVALEVPGYWLTEASTTDSVYQELPGSLQPQQILAAIYQKI